jgi:hypothetical protein
MINIRKEKYKKSIINKNDLKGKQNIYNMIIFFIDIINCHEL